QLSDGTQRYVPQPPAPRSNAASVKDVCVPLTLATTSTSPTSTLSLHDALPISPPTSTTDPGTIPPPSTKSNSGRPVLHRATLLPATSESRTGGTLEGRPFPRSSFPTFRPTSSSTSVFHAPHASQRPPHFGCSAPQSV